MNVEQIRAANKSQTVRDDITVVIPAHNEERTIRDVVRGVKLHVPQARILVVNDGSVDDTGRAATEAGAEVISHPLQKGNGTAVKTALRAISGGRVAIIDGDGQHDPADLPRLLDRLDHYDLVVGARAFTREEGGRLRTAGNLFLRRLASFLCEQNVRDLTSGLRAFHHHIACRFLHIYPNGFSFPSTSTMSFIGAGYSVDFVPITGNPRPAHTQSKLRPFHDGFRFLQLILRVITMANPNKIFFPTGLTLVLIGIALSIRNLILFQQFSGGVVLFLAGGINIMFFGLVLDQFASIRLQERD
ncbi:MAG: glycosyltransferase family 2 protein [Deltaproteobacteria bacterium]|nr:glycosyltransferase family 2 protein [Deltaproteobacteria bacterium]